MNPIPLSTPAPHAAEPSCDRRSADGTSASRPLPALVGNAGESTSRFLALPSVSTWGLRGFTWYARRYLARHFHSLRVSRHGAPPTVSGLPLVVFSNHASWWDPLICLVLKEHFFPDRTAFAPIDAAMLAKYKFFRRLGFFGVETGTLRGAHQFLQTAEAVLSSPHRLLAVTPQGRFVDPRERPVRFQAGLGHLATRVSSALFLPVAAEYVFWEERLPEILVRFGEPVEVRRSDDWFGRAKDWTKLLEQRLADTQDALTVEALRRRSDDFEILLRGGAGQGGVYDAWRWCKARICGETFSKEHGNR